MNLDLLSVWVPVNLHVPIGFFLGLTALLFVRYIACCIRLSFYDWPHTMGMRSYSIMLLDEAAVLFYGTFSTIIFVLTMCIIYRWMH